MRPYQGGRENIPLPWPGSDTVTLSLILSLTPTSVFCTFTDEKQLYLTTRCYKDSCIHPFIHKCLLCGLGSGNLAGIKTEFYRLLDLCADKILAHSRL